MPSRNEHSLYDWLYFTTYELQRLGLTALDRLRRTGHDRRLNHPWIDTVGMWGRSKGSDFYGDRGDNGMHGIRKSNFDAFKYRHNLKTSRQFCGTKECAPWQVAQECFLTMNKVQREHDDVLPEGLAARTALHTYKLGLLPVEILLWHRLFQSFLDQEGLEWKEWLAFEVSLRTEIWERGKQGAEWDVRALFKAKV